MKFSRYIMMFAQLSSLNSLRFANRLALNSFFELIKLLSASGDGEIRTHDPLLARQVLSQLSYAPMLVKVSSLACLFFSFISLFN